MKVWPLALLVLPGILEAQESTVLPLGVRVRLSTAEERVTGTLARLRDDTVAVVPEGRETVLAVSYAAIRGLEVSRGRHARTGQGALIGLGIGLTGGIVTAIAVCRDDQCEGSSGEWTGLVAATLGLGGALSGLGIGALIGSFVHREKWRGVSITWMHTRTTPNGRSGLGLSFPIRIP